MLPTTGGAIARILIVLACFILLAYLALGCLARVARAEGVAPLPAEVVVRFESCKVAPGKAQPLFAGWSRVQADSTGAFASCAEVYPIYPVTAYDGPNDPQISQQYSLERMSVPQAWDTARGDGVVIAILDTGVDLTHPDLAGKFVSRGKDFVNHDDDATDDHGHGTHVAGIAAASTNNGVGIAGVGFNARLLPVKVLAANGGGDTAVIAQAIDWASQQSGVKVINMSLGCNCPTPPYLQDAIDRARARGVVVIAAAGNSSTSSPASPASAVGVLGVGATDSADQRASFSNFGVNAKLAAPGLNIYSTLRGGGYGNMSGTSMASPNAAGVAALVWSACPACSVAEVEARLLNGDTVPAQQVGKRVNAARAVGSSGGPLPTAAPTAVYPTPTVAPSLDTAIVDAINAERKSRSLAPLAIDPALVTIARQHNATMLQCAQARGWTGDCFSHQVQSLGELDLWKRLAGAGYPNYKGSENIGQGCQSVACMMDLWMHSDGHRANILDTHWTHIGAAFDNPDRYYMTAVWTTNFGRRDGQAQPTPTPTRRADSAQPPGYYMLIEVPYDTSTQSQIDALYWSLCDARKPDGVRCTWHKYRTLEEDAP